MIRQQCATTKVTVNEAGGRLSGFVHVERDEAGRVIAVRVLPSRRIGTLLHAWFNEASDILTAELAEPGR